MHLKNIIPICCIFGLSSGSATAEQVYRFDPEAAPYIDSEYSAFMDAMYALRDVCDQTKETWLISLCNQGDDIIEKEKHICLDIANDPPKADDILTECQKQGAFTLATQLQYVFNEIMMNDGEDCKSDQSLQCFAIKGKIFAFPKVPA